MLGVHQVPNAGATVTDAPAVTVALAPHDDPGEMWFDAVDLALQMPDGRFVAFGIRCGSYLASSDDADRQWGSYVPLAVTLDLARVHHWDFNEVMWLGPAPWPCLVWSNAECLTVRSLDVLLAGERRDRLLAGPEGRGLPTLDDIGITLPDGVVFRPIARSLLAGRDVHAGDDLV